MKYVLRLLLGVGACALLISCASGPEAAGDKAYEAAKKATGDNRRTQLKTAYLSYSKAVKENPDKISNKLRERYIDMCITRVKMMLDEGNASVEAIPHLMDDIEAVLTPEVAADLKQRYAAFIVQLGDSSAAKTNYIDALNYYDKAIEKAADPAPFQETRRSVIKKVAEEGYDFAVMEYETGQKEKDPGKFIRAEYFAYVALYYDSTFDKAQKLLSDLRKLNRGTYSAYLSVADDGEEKTSIFKKVNKWDILIAVPTIKVGPGGGTVVIHMYNYSFNHLRMKAEDFSLVDANGKEVKALPSKMDPDFLEYEKEAQYTLRFPGGLNGEIKKITYKNGEHYTEKVFF
jgi:tetratricopeptide (TPR) repeat protein